MWHFGRLPSLVRSRRESCAGRRSTGEEPARGLLHGPPGWLGVPVGSACRAFFVLRLPTRFLAAGITCR